MLFWICWDFAASSVSSMSTIGYVFKTTAEVNSLVVSGEQDTVLLHERMYEVGMVKAGMCKDCNGKKAGKEWNESHKRLKECG
jgi:hypothetical protein